MVRAQRTQGLGELCADPKRRAAHRRAPPLPQFTRHPGWVAPLLAALLALPGHVFWPEDIGLLDAGRADASRLLTSAQVTDTYLLALARAHGGQLASFDRRLVTDAVPEGPAHLHLIG